MLPLRRNPELSPKAKALAADLRRNWNVDFDDTGAIGQRYRRQDEIGTPYCVTVDYETLDDGAVTVRDMWRNSDDYASVLGPFVEDGLAAGEAVMIAVVGRHANWLRESLGGQARKVKFVDMAKLGRNPARIIPAWQKFVDQHSGYGRPVRGIGEPIWADGVPRRFLNASYMRVCSIWRLIRRFHSG